MDEAPFARVVNTFNVGEPVHVVITQEATANGDGPYDLYVVEHKSDEAWTADPLLEDVRAGGPQTVSFNPLDAEANVVPLEDAASLESTSGIRPGHSYDLIIDLDGDGLLSDDDILDGGDLPGLFIVGNLNNAGPLAVSSFDYELDFWHTMRVFHPTELDGLGMRPLVVISHGWTHEFTYYDYLAEHLASYGYVVISHRNDVGYGAAEATETASQTALENIDTFLANYPDMNGGVLDGHVNKHLIVHAGHSTGGECVVRAYTRLLEGDYLSPHITHNDIVLLQTLAPVSFLDGDDVSPHEANYHTFIAGADTDVTGAPLDSYVQALAIYERGTGNKQVTYIHGAGHEDLHGNPGDSWADGPDLIGREATHTVVRPYFLAACELYAHNNLAFKEYFTRNRHDMVPLGIQTGVTVTGEYREHNGGELVIDDYQSNPSLSTTSSGGVLDYTTTISEEILMKDTDGSFAFSWSEWANGMVRSRYDDFPRCGVYAWENDASVYVQLYPYTYLMEDMVFSFRAAYVTRHLLNEGSDGLSFELEFYPDEGPSCVIPIEPWGKVLPPYPRSNGGYYTACLLPGEYTLNIGGSTWEEEMLVTIPDYLEEVGAGSHTFTIPEDAPCTTIEVLCYDTWGDGWDAGSFTITDISGDSLLTGTLPSGSLPDSGQGWQNEFHVYNIPIDQLKLACPGIQIESMLQFAFHFGPSHGSPTGAIAIDDIAITGAGLNYVASVDEQLAPALDVALFPNPATTTVRIAPEHAGPWQLRVVGALGQVLPVEPNHTGTLLLQTATWASGVYIVEVTQGQQTVRKQLVVQH